MPIFTARENFKREVVTGSRYCKSCKRFLQGKNALVLHWQNKKRADNSLAVCDEECWSNYDHNFWLEKAAGRAMKRGRDSEAIELLENRLPEFGEKQDVS